MNILTYETRRNFMKGLLGASTSILARQAVPSLITLSFATASIAEETSNDIAKQTTALINSIPRLFGLGEKPDGDALRSEAIKITLNQMLDNQQSILDSIADISKSIEDLKQAIGGQFSQHKLHERYVDVKKFFDKLKVATETLARDPSKLKSQTAYDEFSSLSRELIDISSGFNTTVDSIDMKRDGVALIFIVAQTANILKEAQKNFALLELKFSDFIKRPEIFSPENALRKNLELFGQVLEKTVTTHLKNSQQEQEDEKNQSISMVNTTVWHNVSDFLFSRSATNSVPEDDLDVPLAAEKIAFSYYIDSSFSNQVFCENTHKTLSVDDLPSQNDSYGAEYKSSALFTLQRFDFLISTVDLSGDGIANAIVKIDLISRIKGTDNVTQKIICGVRHVGKPVSHPSPETLYDNLPESQRMAATKGFFKPNDPSYLENFLSNELPIWQRNLQLHARASAYSAALEKLKPVLQEISQHNTNMIEILMPLIEEQRKLNKPHAPSMDHN